MWVWALLLLLFGNAMVYGVLSFRAWRARRKLPGPRRWIPFHGNLVPENLWIKQSTMQKWLQSFGSFFELHTPDGVRAVVVSDPDALSSLVKLARYSTSSDGSSDRDGGTLVEVEDEVKQPFIGYSIADLLFPEHALSITVLEEPSVVQYRSLLRRWCIMDAVVDSHYQCHADLLPLAAHAATCADSVYRPNVSSPEDCRNMCAFAMGLAVLQYTLTPSQKSAPHDWVLGTRAPTDAAHIDAISTLTKPLLPVVFTTLKVVVQAVRSTTREPSLWTQLRGHADLTRAQRNALDEIRVLISDHVTHVACERLHGHAPIVDAVLNAPKPAAPPTPPTPTPPGNRDGCTSTITQVDQPYTVAELVDAIIDILVTAIHLGASVLGPSLHRALRSTNGQPQRSIATAAIGYCLRTPPFPVLIGTLGPYAQVPPALEACVLDSDDRVCIPLTAISQSTSTSSPSSSTSSSSSSSRTSSPTNTTNASSVTPLRSHTTLTSTDLRQVHGASHPIARDLYRTRIKRPEESETSTLGHHLFALFPQTFVHVVGRKAKSRAPIKPSQVESSNQHAKAD